MSGVVAHALTMLIKALKCLDL